MSLAMLLTATFAAQASTPGECYNSMKAIPTLEGLDAKAMAPDEIPACVNEMYLFQLDDSNKSQAKAAVDQIDSEYATMDLSEGDEVVKIYSNVLSDDILEMLVFIDVSDNSIVLYAVGTKDMLNEIKTTDF